MQRRTVHCPKSEGCDPHARPSDTRLCDMGACVAWATGPWEQVKIIFPYIFIY